MNEEEGWIIAAKRRDGKVPSFTKGVSDCYTGDAVYVYPREADATRDLLEEYEDRGYAVFKVEITVKPLKRAGKSQC